MEINYQQFKKKGGNELGPAISEILDNDGDKSPAPAQQGTNKETLGNVELGGRGGGNQH